MLYIICICYYEYAAASPLFSCRGVTIAVFVRFFFSTQEHYNKKNMLTTTLTRRVGRYTLKRTFASAQVSLFV